MGRAARNKDTGLTDKEELFAESLAFDANITISDAYRKAYNCANMKDETVNTKASVLKNRDNIAARVASLKSVRNEKALVDAVWVLNEAVDLYKECRLEGDRTTAKGSLEIIGKHVDVKAWDKTVELGAGESLVNILEAARKRSGV